MNTNKQMSLEDFRKAVMKDNLTPQETVQALRMGY